MLEADLSKKVECLLPKELFNSIVKVIQNSKDLHCEYELKLFDGDTQEKSCVIIDLVVFEGTFEIRVYDKNSKEFPLKLPSWHAAYETGKLPEYEDIVKK